MRYTSSILTAAGLSGVVVAQIADPNLLSSLGSAASSLHIPASDISAASSVAQAIPPYFTEAVTDSSARAHVSSDFATGTPSWLKGLPTPIQSSIVAEYSQYSSDFPAAPSVIAGGPINNSTGNSTTMPMSTMSTTSKASIGTGSSMSSTASAGGMSTTTSAAGSGSFNTGQGSSAAVKTASQAVLAMAGVAGFIGFMFVL